jgi:tetratricopeptide (TPR) repeat protein
MSFLSRAHIDSRRYEEALRWAENAVRLRPDIPDMHFRLAVCLGHLGRGDEAKTSLLKCERLRTDFVAKRATWRPYADPDRNQHFFAGLQRLGLLP